MKRVEAIAKGKASCITDLLNRKAKRIMRGVEQAIDYAADKVEEYNDLVEKSINDLASAAESGMSDALQCRINKYTDLVGTKEGWEAQLTRLKDLKKALEADVKVDEE